MIHWMRPIAYPQVWSTHDTIVCHEHDMWLNGTAFRIDPKRSAIKLVGAAKADAALSHRRHQWLITHRGRDATRQAVRDAYEIVEDWNRWRLLEAIEYRCQQLEPNPAERGLGTSCFNAGAYPDTLMLAAVLTNPSWRRNLIHGPRNNSAQRSTTSSLPFLMAMCRTVHTEPAPARSARIAT